MLIDFKTALIILYVLAGLDVVIIIASLLNKYRYNKRKKNRQTMAGLVRRYFEDGVFPHHLRSNKSFMETYIRLREAYAVDDKTRGLVNDYILNRGIDKSYGKMINSPFKSRRMRAAVYLGHMETDIAVKALQDLFKRENKYIVKVYAANAMLLQSNAAAIPALVESLIGAPSWYIDKVRPILIDFGKSLHDHVPSLLDRDETEIRELLIGFGRVYIARNLKTYLLRQIDSENPELRDLALKALSENYPDEIRSDDFPVTDNVEILKTVIKALSNNRTPESVNTIMGYLQVQELEEHVVYALSTMARQEPKLLKYLVTMFRETTDRSVHNAVTKVLSNRIEYFLLRILSEEKETIKKLVGEILRLGGTSEIIGFLNKNRNPEIENEILDAASHLLDGDETLRAEFSTYLNERILKKLSLEKSRTAPVKREEKKEKDKIRFLTIILILVLAAFPAVFLLRRHDLFSALSPLESVKLFVVDFNYLLVYYSAAVNFIYIIILLLSLMGSSLQARLWKLKKFSFLFRRNILPSISVIAPAYCEEATIIESTNSLLNLKYPDYELIVVNDGSSDDTLNTLISYYALEKYDLLYDRFLETKPIRGIYINKNIPKFVVVDKENGGKADSLNAGINISRKDYFCGIDADSLLEPEALLKAASTMLNTENETVAVGGNIFPINGCTVERGSLEKIALPRNFVALAQAMEYIRAFLAGRIGWALIHSLLIISGAFGIFSKKRIYEIGGYLTQSERYHRDTVGEDMELVVRVSRHMREKKLKHTIHYAFNANCWTEVPERMRILHRQRDRWHRGLLEILSFHRKMIFNPSFGSTGLVAMPYFFIFEMVGPLIEVQGYLMVLAAALTGLLNPYIALLLFISTVMLGILISITSLCIAEKDEHYFSVKEFFILLGLAIIENVGFRQLVSYWRVAGYFNSLKKPKGWGEMVRKGFTEKVTDPAAEDAKS